MSLIEFLNKCFHKLSSAGIESSVFDTEAVFSECLSVPKLELRMNPDREISGAEADLISSKIERRAAREPLQYILGKAWFRELCLEVGPGVLIPRPETELMLEAVREELEKASVIADIGTGSGAVGLSAAYEFPGTYAVCSDISAKALSYAESNRRRYSLDNVLLARGYLLEPFGREVFDVIFANLPYVRDEERNALAPEVIKHEPHSALFADDDGLFLIEKFIDTAADALNAGGTAVIEFGEGQAKRILRKVASLCCYNPCRILDDYSGRERFCIIRKI